MTSVSAPRAPVSPGSPAVRLRPVATRRRPLLALVSAVVVVACTAVVAVAFQHAGRTEAVLVVTRPVAPGASVAGADLRVADVHVPRGVSVVPASAEPGVLGRQAATALVPGSLLNAGDTVSVYAPATGSAVVGVAAAPGQLPAGGVTAGELVDVVATGASQSSQPSSSAPSDTTAGGLVPPAPGAVVAADATVLAVSVPSSSSSTADEVVSVLVARSTAPVVAMLSAAGEAALVVVASS